jgi:Domain of unknown function (DUF4372)
VNVGKTLFAQVMEFVPWSSFARIVQRHGGNAGVRSLTCSEQFRAKAFAQFVGADPNLSHRADRILSQGWKPTLRESAVDKFSSSPSSLISLVLW